MGRRARKYFTTTPQVDKFCRYSNAEHFNSDTTTAGILVLDPRNPTHNIDRSHRHKDTIFHGGARSQKIVPFGYFVLSRRYGVARVRRYQIQPGKRPCVGLKRRDGDPICRVLREGYGPHYCLSCRHRRAYDSGCPACTDDDLLVLALELGWC